MSGGCSYQVYELERTWPIFQNLAALTLNARGYLIGIYRVVIRDLQARLWLFVEVTMCYSTCLIPVCERAFHAPFNSRCKVQQIADVRLCHISCARAIREAACV